MHKQVQFLLSYHTEFKNTHRYRAAPHSSSNTITTGLICSHLPLKIQLSDRACFLRHSADASTRSKHHSFRGERYIGLRNAQA